MKLSRTALRKLPMPTSVHNPASLFDECKSIDQVKQAHAQLITKGRESDLVAADRLLKSLTVSGFPSLSYAQKLFVRLPQRDVFLYNTMIKANSLSPSTSHHSVLLFCSMLRDLGLPPNRYTLVFLFKACGDGFKVEEGEQIRVHAVKLGLESNVFVANALIGMYKNWGMVDAARKVFDRSVSKDLYSWNIMVGGYVNGGEMDRAKELFDVMPERDVVSWSTIIAGYVQIGCFVEALDMFHKMLQVGVTPNEFTMTSALAACANLVALDQGSWIHVYIDKCNIRLNERLLAGLIDMYAKCGEIDLAADVFYSKQILIQNVWPWNAMIGGYAMHGKSREAINLFEEMRIKKIPPNSITFIAILNACSHGHLVEEGRYYFQSMVDTYDIEPDIEHYGCMVDLLGRAGFLAEAESTILNMPMAPDTRIWGSLLSACRVHKDFDLGGRVGSVIKEMEPNNAGCQVLLANVYSACGKWNEAKCVRESMHGSTKQKIPGCSSIELNGVFHEVVVGDKSLPQTKEMYLFLDQMTTNIKNAGYVPELGEVLLDIDDNEEKETALSMHSEKLAIAFGLMNTSPGTPIRIVKNLRVCWDCHEATKFISKVYNRKIIVRDRIRYHHFKEGSCSCNDFW